jgi:hypothetical protein
MSLHPTYAQLVFSYNNTVLRLEQLQARIIDLDTTLSDPSVTGKERKKVRQILFQAGRSLEAHQTILNNLITEMECVARQAQYSLEVAARTKSWTPVVYLPHEHTFGPSDVGPQDNRLDVSSMTGSWMTSFSLDWNSPDVEYPYRPFVESAVLLFKQSDHTESQENEPPKESPAGDEILQQETLFHNYYNQESGLVLTRRATIMEASDDHEERWDRTSRRHTIAELPIRESEISFPNYELGLSRDNLNPVTRSA